MRYQEDAQIARFFVDAIDKMKAIPRVRGAAGVTFLPMSGPGIGTSFWAAGQPEPPPGQMPTTDVRPVTPEFFRTMGIPQVAGRDFSLADRGDTPRVAIVNQTLVNRHLKGENPLGKRIHVNVGNVERGPYEIVGVVGDIKMSTLQDDIRPAVYIPHPQLALGSMTFVVRTDIDPMSLVGGVGAAVRSIDPELPLADQRSMVEVVDATLARPRVIATLLTVFASIALVLAAVGVYGVIAYSVGQRTQEIGVRMALGATPQSVFRMVFGQALRLVAGGVAAGLIVAAALTRVLETLLFDTNALDPATFALTALMLTGVAMFASYVPARRGTRVAPVEALRTE